MSCDSSRPIVTASEGRSGKRFSIAFIVIYLGWLSHGVFSHALQYRVGAHVGMYFTVWDMFCGWSGWAERTHIVAEGASGKFYELTPTPWPEYHAFSDLGRQHYDSPHMFAARIGANCLRHTKHEPISRIHVLSETWSKKFNLRGPLWECLHSEPAEPQHYFHQLATFRPDGTPLTKQATFLGQHQEGWLAASLRSQSPQGELVLVGGRK